MRTTATRKQRITTRIQTIPAILLKWAYLLLILLTVVVNTFSGELPPIARANSRDTTPVPSGIGCIQFNKRSETCKTDGTRPCIRFNVRTGRCLSFSTDTTLGGCLDWNYDTDGYCNEFVIKSATPTCPKNDFDPSGTSGTDCGDGINEPTCSNPNYHYDPDFGVCVQDSPSPTTGSSSPASPGTPLILPCPVDHIKPILPCPTNSGTSTPNGNDPKTIYLACHIDTSTNLITQKDTAPCYYPMTNNSCPGRDATSSGGTNQAFPQYQECVFVPGGGTVPPIGGLPGGPAGPAGGDPKNMYSLCPIDTSTNVITLSGTTSCYYPLPAGGSCNLNEADSKGTNQPYPQYNECVFTPAGGTIPSTGPSSGPPPTSTQCPKGYSPVKSGPNLGMCELASDTDPTHTASMIGATCQTGYAYSQTGLDASTGTCLPNSVGAFTDLSSNCVIPAPTSSNVPILKASAAYATTYSCTYAAATLGCGVNNDYTQECEMMQGVIGGTISGHFSCQGLDRTTLIPKTCISYYGTNTSTSLGLANGTCTSSTGVGASFSAINNCTITACSTDGMNFHTTTGTNNTCLPTEMTVSIDQQCSGVANGQSLSCSYGNGKSTKSRPITIGCDSTIPIHCTATDGSLKIAKNCPDQQSNGSAYHCQMSINGTPTWKELCTPPDGTSVSPHCIVTDANNSTLGDLKCSSAATCTLTDDGTNTMTLNCMPTVVVSQNFQVNCSTPTPQCPTTDNKPPAITESNVACTGDLVADVMSVGYNGTVTVKYPLSQAELQFVLEKLGISSQPWKQQPTQNLPKVIQL